MSRRARRARSTPLFQAPFITFDAKIAYETGGWSVALIGKKSRRRALFRAVSSGLGLLAPDSRSRCSVCEREVLARRAGTGGAVTGLIARARNDEHLALGCTPQLRSPGASCPVRATYSV